MAMIEDKEQCKKCLHYQVCANVMKRQLFIREVIMGEEDPKCEYFLPTADVVPRADVDKIEYTLLGVMHSVDKWLDGDELEQDEVNRAITMREKTLQIVEGLKTDVERLTAEKETLELCVKDLRFRNKELQKANECLAKNCDDLELQVEEAIEFRRNQVKRIFEEIERKILFVGQAKYSLGEIKNKYL